MSSRKSPYGNVFVLLMYALLAASYCVYVGLVVWPVRATLLGGLELVVFHIVLAVQQWSLLTVILSDPGTVPLHWGFHVGDSESKRRRYCLMCHVFKPERCHHCSTCNRCVLNMDHHCPWINNCVGFYNRKAFLLTLFYSNLLALMISTGSLPTAYQALLELEYATAWPRLCIIGVEACAAFLLVVVSAFLRFHVRLVLHNLTTIDTLDKSNAHTNYSLGQAPNWRQVFGENPWLWPFPYFGQSGKPVGDGVHWVYAELEYVDSSWTKPIESETPKFHNSSIFNYSGAITSRSEAGSTLSRI